MTETGTPGDEDQTPLHLAYAEASVLLLESLMLVLVERRIVPLDALIAAVETAVATKQAQIKDRTHPRIATIAAGVLRQIGNILAAAHDHRGREARERPEGSNPGGAA
jgi:hypothetical protein